MQIDNKTISNSATPANTKQYKATEAVVWSASTDADTYTFVTHACIPYMTNLNMIIKSTWDIGMSPGLDFPATPNFSAYFPLLPRQFPLTPYL